MCADVGSRFNRGFEPLAGCPSALARQRREDRHVFLYAFDLLELNGKDLRREPLEHRKRELARLLRNHKPGLQLNEHIPEARRYRIPASLRAGI